MLLVTGATGRVGTEVVKALIAQGQRVRVATTDPERAGKRFGADTEIVLLRFGQPATYQDAFVGTESLFLMRPPAIANVKEKMFPALEVAKTAGIKRVVFLSVQGAEKNPVIPHRKLEDYLKTSGLAYTFLRPSFFMQNLSSPPHREDIAEHNELFIPAGDGKTSFVDVRDIGAVAAKVLSEAGHEGKAYELTGGEALRYRDAATLLSEVLGRDIVYSDPNPLTFWRRMRSRGLDHSYILVMLALYTTCRLGLAARVTGDTERLLGRAPLTLRQFAVDYQDAWRLPAPEKT